MTPKIHAHDVMKFQKAYPTRAGPEIASPDHGPRATTTSIRTCNACIRRLRGQQKTEALSLFLLSPPARARGTEDAIGHRSIQPLLQILDSKREERGKRSRRRKVMKVKRETHSGRGEQQQREQISSRLRLYQTTTESEEIEDHSG